MTERCCTSCRRTLPVLAFYKNCCAKSGYSFSCRDCTQKYRAAYYRKNKAKVKAWTAAWNHGNPNKRRAHRRAWVARHPERSVLASHRYKLKQHGLTLKDYDTLLLLQGGLCAICGQPPTGKLLAVDHCHSTGTVRGLLCDRCNHMIGHAKDEPHRLRAGADYLENGRGGNR